MTSRQSVSLLFPGSENLTAELKDYPTLSSHVTIISSDRSARFQFNANARRHVLSECTHMEITENDLDNGVVG